MRAQRISEGWKRKAVESWKKGILGQGNSRCTDAQAGLLNLSISDIVARSFLVVGTVLHTAGCLAASLASPRCRNTPYPCWDNHGVSRSYWTFPRRELPSLENHCSNRKSVYWLVYFIFSGKFSISHLSQLCLCSILALLLLLDSHDRGVRPLHYVPCVSCTLFGIFILLNTYALVWLFSFVLTSDLQIISFSDVWLLSTSTEFWISVFICVLEFSLILLFPSSLVFSFLARNCRYLKIMFPLQCLEFLWVHFYCLSSWF